MMIGRLALVVLLAALTSSAASAAQAPETAAPTAATDEAEHEALRQLKSAYERAISENNIETLAPYFSDQFHGVMLTGRVVKNFDELKTFWADMRELIGEGGSYTTTLNPERSVISGDVALARGSSSDVVVTSEKNEFRFTSYWTAVLQKQAGQWKLVQVQGNIDPIDNPFVREFNRRENRIVIPVSAIAGLAVGLLAGWWLRRRRHISTEIR